MANRFQAHGQSVNACQWLEGRDRSLVTVSDDKTTRVWVSLVFVANYMLGLLMARTDI